MIYCPTRPLNIVRKSPRQIIVTTPDCTILCETLSSVFAGLRAVSVFPYAVSDILYKPTRGLCHTTPSFYHPTRCLYLSTRCLPYHFTSCLWNSIRCLCHSKPSLYHSLGSFYHSTRRFCHSTACRVESHCYSTISLSAYVVIIYGVQHEI